MARVDYKDLLKQIEEGYYKDTPEEEKKAKVNSYGMQNSYQTYQGINKYLGTTPAPLKKKKKKKEEEEEKVSFSTNTTKPILEVPTVEEAITKFKPKEEAWYNSFFEDVKGVGSSLAYGITEGIGALGTVLSENVPYMLSNEIATKRDMEDYEKTNNITKETRQQIIDKYVKEYGDIDQAATQIATLYNDKAETLKTGGGLAKFQNKEKYEQLEKEVAELEYVRDLLQETRGGKPFTDDVGDAMKAGLDWIGVGQFFDDFKEETSAPFEQVRELGQSTVGETAQKFAQEHSFIGGVAQSVGGLIPAIAATALTKQTAVGTAVFTASAKGSYYENYKERGYTNREAENASTNMAAVELGTEFLGGWLGGINVFKSGALKDIAEKSGVQTIKALGVEGVEEATAELANIGIDLDLGENVTLEEATERIGTAFASGVALGAVMKGAGVAGSKAQALAEKISNNEQVTETELNEALEEVADQNNTTVEALLEQEVTELQQNTEQEQNIEEAEKIEAPQAEINDVSEQEQQVILPEVETAKNEVVEPNTAIEENIPIETAQNVSESEIIEENDTQSEDKKQIQVYNAVRLDEKNANLDAETKPHGLFLSNLYETDFNEFESPFTRQYEDGERHNYKVEPKNPLVVKQLTLDNAKYKYRGGGMVARMDADVSVSALKELVGEQEFTKVSEMSKQELVDYLNNKYSQYDFSKYYDKAELLMAYGSVEARNRGYDAIITERSTDPDTADIDNEIVVLKNDILKTEAENKEATVETAQSDDNITIENEVNDFHSGETFSTMSAKVDGKVVGTLEYSEYEGKPSVKMVEVSPEYRRKGIGTKLLQELQKAYPNTEIDFGMLTDDGAKLIEKSTFEVEDREIANKIARRDRLQEKIDEYDKTIEESMENDTDLPEGYAADYNEIYDELQDLNEELRGKKATKRLVRETPTVEEIDNIIKLKEEGGQKYAKAYYDAVDKYGHTAFYKAMNEGYARAKNQAETVQTEQVAEQVQEAVKPLQETVSELTEQVKKLTDQIENAALNNPTIAENVADTSLDQQVEGNNEPTEMEDTTPDFDDNQRDTSIVESPFENRDIKEVGNRKVKAYMYENPEVKPYFQEAANEMLGDLKRTTKGQRIYNPELAYEQGTADQNGAFGWVGMSRQTTDDIAYLIDNFGYTYAQIEEGLNKIIEDNGLENNAVSKRIEFMLDERLRNGYVDVSGAPMPANQDYINLLDEKQISEYNSNRFADMTDEEVEALVRENTEISTRSIEKEVETYITKNSLNMTADEFINRFKNIEVETIDNMTPEQAELYNLIKNIQNNNVQYSLKENYIEDNSETNAIERKINQTMTMAEAEDMIQRAFAIGDIYSYYDGQYKNGEEWLAGEGSDSVAMVVENDYHLHQKFLNKLDDLYDDYTVEDIIDAYQRGTLTGKQKDTKANRLDLTTDTGFLDDKFYSPKGLTANVETYRIASQRVTNQNREAVYKARADFITNAHNKGYIESLGLTQTEVNQKLKNWANYPKRALEMSNYFNEGVATQNRWTGIENSSIVNTLSITEQDLSNMVKNIKGNSNEWQRSYITSTMLALDTHINYKNLTYEFNSDVGGKKNVLGDYSSSKKTIRISRAGQNTVAHETGHYIDNTWGEEIFGSGHLTDKKSTERLQDTEVKQWVENFYKFIDNVENSSDIRSEYTMSSNEVFARFVARFTEWTKNVATNNRYGYEDKYYKDNFTESQYREFVKLLQEKAKLDTTKSNLYKQHIQTEDRISDERIDDLYNQLFGEKQVIAPIATQNANTDTLTEETTPDIPIVENVSETVTEAPVEETVAPTLQVSEEVTPTQETTDGVQQQWNEDGEIVDTETIEKKTKGEIQRQLIEDAGLVKESLDNAKDVSKALMHNTDPIRLQEIIFGKEIGGKINDAIFQTVKHNTAEKIRFQNQERDEIKELGIKPRSKESAAVQKYGEKQYVNEAGETVAYKDAELQAEFPDTDTQDKIKYAAKVIRQKYDTYIDMVNDEITKYGYDPIPKRQDYMRHFQELNDVFSRYGLPFNMQSAQANDLPVDINGLTADLKPGKNWFSSALRRKGNKTTYDAITGIDGYIEGIGNLIYHTKDIQTLRGFENYVREMYGQENGFDNLDNLSDGEKAIRIQQIQNNHLGNYAAWLREYTNTLAGKKAMADRAVEDIFGRKVYSFLNELKSQVGSNMTGLNIGSALTNPISMTQALAKTNKLATVKGYADTIKNIFIKDNFAEQNDFLTARFGSDLLAPTTWQKMRNAGQIFMTGTDWFASNSITRSKFYELKAKGMSDAEAHKEAGIFAAKILGDRSQGATPTLYNSKMLGLVTQFQLEVNNQLYSQFYDTFSDAKQTAKEKGVLKAAAGATFVLGQLAAFQHIYNDLYEAIAGRRPAFDIISMIATALGLGGDEEEEKKPLEDRLYEAADMLLDSLPYVSTFTGGGRIPISDALPISELISGEDQYGNEKSRLETLSEALPYYFLPTGYGQLKKTIGGLGMYDEELPVAGSYTDSGNLRFTAEEDAWSKVQAGLFGQWANPNAKEYIDSGFKSIDKENIDELAELGFDSKEYNKYKKGLNEIKNMELPDGEARAPHLFEYIESLNVTDKQKSTMIRNLLSDEEAKDVYDKLEMSSENIIEYYDAKATISQLEAENVKDENKRAKVIDTILDTNLTSDQKAYLYGKYYSSDKTLDKITSSGIDFNDYLKFTKETLDLENTEAKVEHLYNASLTDNTKTVLYETSVLSGFDNEEKYKDYKTAKTVGIDINAWLSYKKQEFKADKDRNGKSIDGTKKKKVFSHINSLDLSVPQKAIMFKLEYPADKDYVGTTYNNQIVSYVDSLDIDFKDKLTTLENIGFKVDDEGNVKW